MDAQALNEWISAKIAAVQPTEGTFTPSDLAAELAAKLAATEPETFSAWLHMQGTSTIKEAISSKLMSERGKARSRARAGAFAEVMKRVEAGDAEALKGGLTSRMLETWYAVDEDGTRRLLKDMTKEDHEFVATSYEKAANRSRLLASFHRTIAQRLAEGQKTADLLTEEEVDRLYNHAFGDN